MLELTPWILTIVFTAVSAWLYLPVLKRKKWNRKHKEFYQSIDSPIEPVYTDMFGNKWYRYTNHLILPAKRTIRVEMLGRHAMICISENMWAQYIVKLKAACNKGKMHDVSVLVGAMEERSTRAAEAESLLELANAFFLIEGEDPKATSEFWGKKKKEIWSKDSDCEAFFLICAFAIIKDSNELSDTDLLHSLTMGRLKDQPFHSKKG